VQDDESEAGEHVPVDPLNDLVGYLVVRRQFSPQTRTRSVSGNGVIPSVEPASSRHNDDEPLI
jgi:hypothetical protein